MKLMLMKQSQQPHLYIGSTYSTSESFHLYCIGWTFSHSVWYFIFKLFFRLVNAYAEEAAIEDSIYYIGEALRNGVLDLEVFLKHVRQLSRRQFMLRALMQKCRQKAGLAG